MLTKSFLITLCAFSIIGPSKQNWFTEKMTSGYGYLKTMLFGADPFKLKNGEEVHTSLSKKFLELKDDGLSLTYNMIYYNLALNLERDCYFNSDSVDDCELFVNHIKNIITRNIETGEKGKFKYLLIEDFFKMIFDVTQIDQRLSITEQNRVKTVLESLGSYFNGKLFEEDKEKLTFQYNEVLRRLMMYLTKGAGIAPEIKQEGNPDDPYDIDFSLDLLL